MRVFRRPVGEAPYLTTLSRAAQRGSPERDSPYVVFQRHVSEQHSRSPRDQRRAPVTPMSTLRYSTRRASRSRFGASCSTRANPLAIRADATPRSWEVVPGEKRLGVVSRRDPGDRSWRTMPTHRPMDNSVNINGTLTEKRHQILPFQFWQVLPHPAEVPEFWPSSTPWPPGTRTRHAPRFFSHQSVNDSATGFGRSL